MDDIWKTPEAEAWAKDFCYEDYLMYCKVAKTTALSEIAYLRLCRVFDLNMKESMKL